MDADSKDLSSKSTERAPAQALKPSPLIPAQVRSQSDREEATLLTDVAADSASAERTQPPPIRTLAGCRWDFDDYSCAYDASLVPVLHVLRSSGPVPHLDPRQYPTLSRVFELSRSAPSPITQQFLEERWRQVIRSRLHRLSPTTFRNGRTFASVFDVCDYMSDHQRPLCSTDLICDVCTTPCALGWADRLLSEASPDAVRMLADLRHSDTVMRAASRGRPQIQWSDWLDSVALMPFVSTEGLRLHRCLSCRSSGPFHIGITLTAAPPPLLFFDVTHFSILPPRLLDLPSNSAAGHYHFRLFVGMYFARAHFTSRFFDFQGASWAYDSQRDSGNLVRENPTSAVKDPLYDAPLTVVGYVLLSRSTV